MKMSYFKLDEIHEKLFI